jgi:hypothetical protein
MIKKDNQSKVGDLTRAIMKQYGIDKKYMQYKATEEVMLLLGPMQKFVQQVEIKNQTLYIQISSAPYRSELMNSRSLLIKNLNKNLGEEIVKAIHIY